MQGQLEVCDLDECDFWQCEILEYDDREDFVLDTLTNLVFFFPESSR